MATARAFLIKKLKPALTTQQSTLSLMLDYTANFGKSVEILRRMLHCHIDEML
jgi:hypothetical protein